jgi:hypothetical protein
MFDHTDTAHSANSSHRHGELIGQATNIIMNRFDLDAAQALQVLRRMSQVTGTHLRVVAESVIHYHDPVQALRRLEEDALDCGPANLKGQSPLGVTSARADARGRESQNPAVPVAARPRRGPRR